MNRPRNVVALYVAGRAPETIAAQAQALEAVSSFRALTGVPKGWLVASDGTSGNVASEADGVVLIEGNARSSKSEPALSTALERGAGALRAIEGEVGFCRVQAHGALDAVRSCGGLVPLYYCVTPDLVCVATRLRDLFWLCPRELAPDPLVHAIWSAGNAIFPDERTFFRDVKVLPKGHVLRVRDGRAHTTDYWEPRASHLPTPSPRLADEHARELREALLGSLADGLSTSATNLLTLSGGVDSSSMAVLSNRLGRPLGVLTFVAPRSSPARAKQLSYVQPLVHDLGISVRHLIDAEDERLDGLFSTPLSTLCHCPHPALRILPQLGTPIATLLSGHFADELCGYSQRRQDWVRHTSFRQLLDPSFEYGLRDAMRWGKRRALGLMGRAILPLPHPLGRLYSREVRAELDEWRSRTRARMLSDPRPLRELAAWVELDAWVAMHWEVASVANVVPVHPFFGRRTLELGFRCHPSELFGPGHKKILRRALEGLVPTLYLERPDKGHWQRPARRDLGHSAAKAGSLAAAVHPDYQHGGATDLSWQERRKLEQLSLFDQALRRERAFSAALQRGCD